MKHLLGRNVQTIGEVPRNDGTLAPASQDAGRHTAFQRMSMPVLTRSQIFLRLFVSFPALFLLLSRFFWADSGFTDFLPSQFTGFLPGRFPVGFQSSSGSICYITSVIRSLLVYTDS